MKLSDFFNKMPCIVDMNGGREKPEIREEDEIVQVEYVKESYPFFRVYYFHRIYNDDRIYKCEARFKRLPDIVRRWTEEREPKENNRCIKWNGEARKNVQLSFDV